MRFFQTRYSLWDFLTIVCLSLGCASLFSKSVVQLMTNDSIELHTKASSSMIVKVEEVFFPSSSSMAMAMWFEENLNDVCSSLLANDDHTTLHSPVYN